MNRSFNQSAMLVTVETDIGITGIGEGGSPDLIQDLSGSLMGRIRSRSSGSGTTCTWTRSIRRGGKRSMGRARSIWRCGTSKARRCSFRCTTCFTGPPATTSSATRRRSGRPVPRRRAEAPAGRCSGARALAAAVAASECRSALRDRARAAMEAGYRCFRVDAVDRRRDSRQRLQHARACAPGCGGVQGDPEGVGQGDWMIDFHQKFDFADALRCCRLIEEYEPFLVEDPVRDEQALEEIPKLRMMTTCPLSHGEEWGQRWDFHRLVYNKDIDYIRGTLPNVGGITEMVKIMSLCETSAVGIVPHFTGPVSTAALVHTMSTFSGPVLMEYNYGDRPPVYLPDFLTFKNGKLYHERSAMASASRWISTP